MICHECKSDNIRGATECSVCGATLNVMRHSCSFVNFTTDMYCGGCGLSLLKVNVLTRKRLPDEYVESTKYFSEQELLSLLDLQQNRTMGVVKKTAFAQDDVDKLFN
jgi:hypothetical protein